MTEHNHNVKHDRLHAVEPHEMMQLLVLDHGKEEDKEDDQRSKLGREVHFCERSRNQIKHQKITETAIDFAPERDGINPGDEIAQRRKNTPHEGRWALVCGSVSSTRLKTARCTEYGRMSECQRSVTKHNHNGPSETARKGQGERVRALTSLAARNDCAPRPSWSMPAHVPIRVPRSDRQCILTILFDAFLPLSQLNPPHRCLKNDMSRGTARQCSHPPRHPALGSERCIYHDEY